MQPTYYDKEFAQLGDKEPANMQIRNEYGQTRWLAVTPDQIEAILKILNDKEAKDSNNYHDEYWDLLEICYKAIRSGDWKVDGACDPDRHICKFKQMEDEVF